MNQDTIAAISTGMTNSGIGIVRISGSEALEIADRVYKGKETITEVPTHTIHYGHVMDGDETVDEVLVMVMRGPRTFTGEDTVEINCHGGTYVVSRVVRKTDKKFSGRVCGITYECLMLLPSINDDQIAFKNFVDVIVDPIVTVTGQNKRHLDKIVAVVIVLIGKTCPLPGEEKGRI